MALLIPNVSGFNISDVRAALKTVLEAAAPKATVHKEWKLEVDPVSSLGKTTGGMNGKEDHGSFVHSFMIGLSDDTENAGEGGTYATVGGGTSDYNLTFAVWGFFDYKSWRVAFGTNTVVADASPEKNAVAFAEDEWRKYKAYCRLNPTLDLASGRVRYVFPPRLESLDKHPFSNGKEILVLQSTLIVRVRESYA